MKKFFAKTAAIAVAITLAAMPLTVSAASGSSSGSSPSSTANSNTSSGSTASGTSSSSSKSSHHKSKGGGSASTTTAKSTASVVTAGGVVTSTIGGSYTATVVNGTAVTTPKSEVNAAFGLKGGEVATVVIRDSRAGDAARKCLSDAAAALGLEMGPIIDFYGMATTINASRTIDTFAQPITLVAGIPASMRMDGVEYAMIRVISGGQVDVLVDIDADPNTITFNTDASGVYMLVAAPAGYFAMLTAAN